MSIHVALNHVTEYRYDRAVELGPQIVRLRPAPHSRTRVLSYSLKVQPEGHFINWQQDPQGNYLARLVFPEKTQRLRVEVDLVAEMAVFNPFDFFLEPYAQTIPFTYAPDERQELAPYLEKAALAPGFEAYLETVDHTPRPTVEFLVALNQRVSQDVSYLVRMQPGVQTPEQTLERGCGSCRDSAWLLVQLLRNLGLAARFVSGYLIQLKADVAALNGPSGTDVDFTDLHAWCEVYLPGAGWVGLDATSGLLAGEGHIPLACSPAPTSAAPITGRVEPCECDLSHAMSVRRIYESPRVTQPYSHEQWQAMLALGEQVDQTLQAEDMRLTMGNRLTFVAGDSLQDTQTPVEMPVQASATWAELVERTEAVYEEARAARLASERFMLDGRHVGTGGGNLVLGAATAEDSPFLRRPDLLRSLVSYWLDHPSLSYLFTGQSIGPGSDAPRVDEARSNALYELEIAFAHMPAGEHLPAWRIDRLLSGLLTNVTGNPQRAEFRIDKLYNPDNPAGLLELQGFETQPHARMALAPQLLVRALIARFWQQPYAPTRLARWGNQLHDRFMLPHFVSQDLSDVLAQLTMAGFTFQPEWFAPHMEFRFPKLGDYSVGAMHIELRQALEPRFDCTEGGTGVLDAAPLERLEVKVSGLLPQRYVLTCNGQPVPLYPTDHSGEYVGGVRYQPWQPAAAPGCAPVPHPPLVFDLIDTWNQHSLGGCQYHVVHPGGRNYGALPVNANEAESRRLARFFRVGHTPGDVQVPPVRITDDYPQTLDLRRFT